MSMTSATSIVRLSSPGENQNKIYTDFMEYCSGKVKFSKDDKCYAFGTFRKYFSGNKPYVLLCIDNLTDRDYPSSTPDEIAQQKNLRVIFENIVLESHKNFNSENMVDDVFQKCMENKDINLHEYEFYTFIRLI